MAALAVALATAAASLASAIGAAQAGSAARLQGGGWHLRQGAAQASHGAVGSSCHARLTLLAHGQGSPDDMVFDGHTLLISDINRGTIGALMHGHVRTVARHIRAPEGIVPGPAGSIIVAEQATNRILEIKLSTGARTTLAKLPLAKGAEGIDGIDADGPGRVFIPDSDRGRLYVLTLKSRRLRLVARGMIRPVAAINWKGAIVVADEYANAVWRIARDGKRTRLATVTVPDDLAVISGHLIANGLLGSIYEVAPHLRVLSTAFAPASSDPQGLVADGPDAVIVADQSRNAIYRLSRLGGCL